MSRPHSEKTARADRSRPYRLFGWALVGLVAGTFYIVAQATAVDGLSGLLQMSAGNPMRPILESDLGQIPVSDLGGHDGPFYYAIALDLTGERVLSLLDLPALRYRRIGLPLIASFGGMLEGRALLLSFAAVSVIGYGVIAGASADILERLDLSRWHLAAVIANPGLWISLRLLTPDVLATAFAALAISFALRRRHAFAILALTASVLTKETFILVSVSLALWHMLEGRRRLAAVSLVVPSFALASWGLVVSSRTPGGLSPSGNLTLPFEGIASAIPRWAAVSTTDLVWSLLSLAVLTASIILALRLRSKLYSAIVAPWAVVAIITSEWVWEYGNSSIRAFAILFVTASIGFECLLRDQRIWSLRNFPV